MTCDQEWCANWTGDGCACQVLGVEPDIQDACSMSDHRNEGDGVCACGTMIYDVTLLTEAKP